GERIGGGADLLDATTRGGNQAHHLDGPEAGIHRMTDRVFAIGGDLGVASDGVQWSLCYRCNDRGRVYWRPVSFVRSSRDILARCMREKGVNADVARSVLPGPTGTLHPE